MGGGLLDDAFSEAASKSAAAHQRNLEKQAAGHRQAREWLDAYSLILRDLPGYVRRAPSEVLLVWSGGAAIPAVMARRGLFHVKGVRNPYEYGSCSAWEFRYDEHEGQHLSIYIAADRTALFRAEWGFHRRVTYKPWGWKKIPQASHAWRVGGARD